MSLQIETTEALCSALYQLPWAEFLGEQDTPDGGRVAWFHIGEKPKDMRVSVIRSKPGKSEEVRVRMEWRNYAMDPRNPLKCEQTIHLQTYEATQASLKQSTEAAVLRVLEVYKDVLSEEGVAGPEPLASYGVNTEE